MVRCISPLSIPMPPPHRESRSISIRESLGVLGDGWSHGLDRPVSGQDASRPGRRGAHCHLAPREPPRCRAVCRSPLSSHSRQAGRHRARRVPSFDIDSNRAARRNRELDTLKPKYVLNCAGLVRCGTHACLMAEASHRYCHRCS